MNAGTKNLSRSKLTDLSELKHGDRVVITEINAPHKFIALGNIEGSPWVNHPPGDYDMILVKMDGIQACVTFTTKEENVITKKRPRESIRHVDVYKVYN